MRALFFTQQTIGLGARKTSMIFIAEALAAAGWDVSIVTVQLSRVTGLKRGGKLAAIPAERRNRWYDHDNMHGFLWVPVAHPLRLPRGWMNVLTAPLVHAYGTLLPRALRGEVARADLVVIESCAAVALFRTVKRLAPRARIVYSMSDRLLAVGMHPALQTMLTADAPRYDLIRVPAHVLLDDLPGANAAWIPHGLDKTLFDAPSASPYGPGAHAVLAGDMMLDQALLAALAEHFAHVGFHYFGRTKLDPANTRPNLTAHGEVPFPTLVPYIQHADVGLALYTPSRDLDYLAQSSLKNLQYRYAGLPTVAPAFIARGLPGAFAYDPADRASAFASMAAALARGRGPIEGPPIQGWSEVAAEIVARAGLEVASPRS